MRRRTVLGAALALSVACSALAQRSARIHRIGYLSQHPGAPMLGMLRTALAGRGWREGESVRFEVRSAGDDSTRWEGVARDLVDAQVDVIVALGTHMSLAAKRVTASVPIVMMLSGYPVEAGLVASLARPGGNVTGLRTYVDGIWGKYIELLREAVPTLQDLGVLTDYAPPAFPEREFQTAMADFRAAAETLGIRLRIWEVRNEADFKRALAEVDPARVQALFVTTGPVHGQPRNLLHLKEFLVRRRMPMMNDISGSVFREAGGVITYAVGWKEATARTASFVDRILKGAKPGELPVEQPTRFELVLNMKVAKALGLKVPQSILLRADRVIE